ncbi:AGE family epimerase/isomerase [Jiella avicenniae]|uniref:AGE family epimerase/isomerase n=1 Tax=Jiella avicenniae TaxID=2907202 RepID=A0A9X1T774_9HYPH|nr:AGE family epimerase/isomerase [Jiella avicenniae]MCE7030972.1 AGE family epimerase/isomerase [Jiella avicenniae]
MAEAETRGAAMDMPAHRRWLEAEGRRLLDFSKASRLSSGGFCALDMAGARPQGAVADTIVTARMTYSYALAAMQGLPGSVPLVDHGLAALSGLLRDGENGGWYEQDPGSPSGGGRKKAYVQAFVALAASAAAILGRPGGRDLLPDVLSVIAARFWAEDEGAMRESFSADFGEEEDYRGANANMHSLEAFMAAFDATGDSVWLDRSLRIAERFANRLAREMRFVIPEHFSLDWTMLKDFHADKPDHPFRPYGTTPGHSLEWSHLCLKLEAGLTAAGRPAPAWLAECAAELFAGGIRDGWNRDGATGFVYTIGWDGAVSVPNTAHWPLAEGITAAALLYRRTGDGDYARWYRRFWDYVDLHLIDRRQGSWWNEVDADNRPSERIYQGKPDLYHAYQPTLTPRLPIAASIPGALARGELQD